MTTPLQARPTTDHDEDRRQPDGDLQKAVGDIVAITRLPIAGMPVAGSVPVAGLVGGSRLGALRRHNAVEDPLGGQPAPAEVVDVLQRRRGAGAALPSHIEEDFGAALGHDLSQVRVHHDSEADKIARSVGATAFTAGTDVYFAAGSYAPGTAGGHRLLAHELAHVAQPAPAVGAGVTIGRADDPAEAAADRVADSVLTTLRRMAATSERATAERATSGREPSDRSAPWQIERAPDLSDTVRLLRERAPSGATIVGNAELPLRRRLLRAGGGGLMLRRTIDEATLDEAFEMQTAMDTVDLKDVLPQVVLLTEAITLFLAANVGELAAAQANLRVVATATETAALDLRVDLADKSPTSPLALLRRLAERIARESKPQNGAQLLAAAGRDYTQTTEPTTLAAVGAGRARHLLITPQPGIAESGAVETYPKGADPADKMQLALPAKRSGQSPFPKITMTGSAAPPVLDVLVIGGGHGGINATFEQEEFGSFHKQYWIDNVVTPLVAKKVTADLIVLDACLTSTMIDAFVPLCSARGRIFASMYSINRTVLPPEVWEGIFAAGASDARQKVVTDRVHEVALTASASPTEGLLATIQSSPSNELKAVLATEPGLAAVVSALRYLPKIANAVAGFLRAKSAARRAECVTELRDLKTADPKLDHDDAELAEMAAELLESDLTQTAVELVRERMRTVSGSVEDDLGELNRAITSAAPGLIASVGAADIPAQIAVYEHASKEIRFDKKFSEAEPRRRVLASTGVESHDEMGLVRDELELMAHTLGLTLKEVDANEIVTGAAPQTL